MKTVMMIVVALSSFAFSSVVLAGEGKLNCDDKNGDSTVVSAFIQGKTAQLSISSDVKLKTVPAKVLPLINGNLRQMDKVVIKDKAVSATFRVDGADVYGKARLEIKVSGVSVPFTYSNCIVGKDSKATTASL